jgi:hypothetical protein
VVCKPASLFPSPLRGGVRGGGNGRASVIDKSRPPLTPTPGPSPQGGGENHPLALSATSSQPPSPPSPGP